MPTHLMLELLSHADGYGKIFFQVDAGGALVHQGSCHYLKPQRAETIRAFLDRVTAQLRPGDDVEIICQAGQVELARISRPAAATG